MNFTVSNASANTARLLAEAGVSVAPQDLEAAPSQTELAIFAVGICLGLLWLIRRIIYPRKLSLADAPGRANKLTPVPVLVLLLMFMMFGAVLFAWLSLLFEAEDARPLVLAQGINAVIWLAASLAVAAATFRFGLVRGLGLSARHWIYDTLRAVYAYLAIFPVCLALVWVTSLLLPEDWVVTHPILEAMAKLPAAWQVLLVLVTAVIVPVAEELLFRGILQSMVRRYMRNAWAAVLITSAVFAVMHFATPQNIPALFALSVVMGYTYERSGRLLSPILIHVIFNAVSVTLFLTRMTG